MKTVICSENIYNGDGTLFPQADLLSEVESNSSEDSDSELFTRVQVCQSSVVQCIQIYPAHFFLKLLC